MLPDSRGLDTVARTLAQAPAVPVVVLTGLEDKSTGTRAIRIGAQDFLIKGQFDSNVLGRSLRYAIERRRRQRAEAQVDANRFKLEMAREIQQGVLPVRDPELVGFDISGATVSAEAVGGDYFDYVPLADGSLGVVVGDATGHGFGPALMIMQTQAYVRALSMTHSSVGHILTLANRALADGTQWRRFVTLCFARLDPGGSSLTYSSAGHTEGYVLSASGEVKSRLRNTNLPLGLDPREMFQESEPVHLELGDLVLLISDGIVEAQSLSRKAFGVGALLDAVRSLRARPAREVVAGVLQAVQDFSSHLPPSDDMTAVAVKIEERARRDGT
jgi:serine phosphatase RsbU (regulator of sigma subunit)